MSTTGDVLKLARDTIASGRWTKGEEARYVGGENHYCAWGAVRHAEEVIRAGFNVVVMAHLALAAATPNGSIPGFNDNPSTTLPDVVNLFDKALAELGEL